MEKLNINGVNIGCGEPPYIIAEIGANHNGDMQLCKRMIDAAKDCGANAVKFQSWSVSSLISETEYARNTSYSDKRKHFGSLKEMVEKYQLTGDQHFEIVSYCADKDITFLSTCYSPMEVDLLDSLGVPAFKIASMDINHLPLLKYVAKKEKPVILSTGMANLGEIERAVNLLKDGGSGPIALLHCVSLYPPDYQSINLRNMLSLQQVFDIPVGFSDHTLGTSIPLAAIALGACLIEKHFTLDKQMDGWDHAISADPIELRTIVNEGLNIFNALGGTVRHICAAEISKRQSFRRCLVAKQSLKKGEKLQLDHLDFKRPGKGINPDELSYVIGRTINRDIQIDEEIQWADLA